VSTTPLTVYRDHLTGDAPLDTAVSRAILAEVTTGELGEVLELGTPHRVVAFGKHDTLTEGFSEAVAIAKNQGYDPTVRIAGGRAVVFSPTIVRFAWTVPVLEAAATMHARFQTLADAVVGTLAALGVDASVGEIPGEYCAGQYSVHVLGSRKVMGVGQRLTRSAAQVGGMIVVSDRDDINAVLIPVYEALGVPMDPTATGSIADVSDLRPDTVMDAFIDQIADQRHVTIGEPSEHTLSLARDFRADHVPLRVA
jgi:lipoate-protein ligase A